MGIRKVISSTEDAAHAPYNSITLSKTFQLDSFNIEDDLDNLNSDNDPQLADTSTFKRLRKNVFLSFLMNISKLNKKRIKDRMSFEPLLTGLCDDIRNICKEDIVSTELKMSSSQDDEEEPTDNDPPSRQLISTPPMSRDDFTTSTCYREGLGVEDTDS
uniref:Uncharacterized protein n=1 Tax=Solanum lycopersicum TaxID=4081 RepID=K4AW78_SOLLC